jgi:hypothetical protein
MKQKKFKCVVQFERMYFLLLLFFLAGPCALHLKDDL